MGLGLVAVELENQGTHEDVVLSAAPARRRRVLVSAYAVSPARGSEPGIGWNIATRLAKWHDVTVICSPQVPPKAQMFRDEIERYIEANGPIPGLSFHYVEPPLASYLLQRERSPMRQTVYYSGYRAWQRAAYHAAQQLHHERPFDLVHQLNITGFREPGYLWKLTDVPFVWGPIGGAANVPKPFLSLMSTRERLFHSARSLANAWQQRTQKRSRQAARRASHIWTIGEANTRLVRDLWGCDSETMIEAGAEPLAGATPRDYDPSLRPLKLVWSGAHLGRKALPILLQALASPDAPQNIELTVLGSGAETERWKALATQLRLGAKVRWTGNLPREIALREMNAADAFVSTSVLEETSLVVLEALSAGLPVICHDACGMGVAVTDECGIKLPMQNPELSAQALAAALKTLAAGGAPFRKLSEGALRRAEELHWDVKAASMARTYERVVATRRT